MYRIILLACFAMATAVSAQDSAEENEPAATAETDAEIIERVSEEELQELGIDDQEDYMDEDEDVFKPTDAVSYSQSVQFPVDI